MYFAATKYIHGKSNLIQLPQFSCTPSREPHDMKMLYYLLNLMLYSDWIEVIIKQVTEIITEIYDTRVMECEIMKKPIVIQGVMKI